MIVRMVKAFAVCRDEDRDSLLRRLRQLGVLHILPASPHDPAEDERGDLHRRVDAALRALHGVEPSGPHPQLTAPAAAAEVMDIQRRDEEGRIRLETLQRTAERQRLWGDVRTEQLTALKQAGAELHVLSVPDQGLPELRGRWVQVLQPLPGRRHLVVVVGLDEDTLPTQVQVQTPPRRDRASLRAEAATIEQELAADGTRLAQLAHLTAELEAERDRLAEEEHWRDIVRCGLQGGRLYAVQGWVPVHRAGDLVEKLPAGDFTVAVRIQPPQPGEHPPTLIHYRWWARPIDRLFRMLALVPGYDEVDVSSAFMVALPVFAGMIIGDAGYGILFAMVPFLLRRRLGIDRDMLAILVLFGVAALIWGAITGVWFGLTPQQISHAGGGIGSLGAGLGHLMLVRGSESETRMMLIKICFVLGSMHLIAAHIRQVLAQAPDPSALAEVGWCVILAAMLGLIWILFFGQSGPPPRWLAPAVTAGLAVGLILVAGYSVPHRPFASRIGLGLAGALLPFLGAFGDTLSYIRLMAVGLASYYLGSTFNILAADLAGATSWVLGAPILLFGHLLNIGLILIAIFAHGVRLNVLEFSSNARIHWAGYLYRPFSDRLMKERE